MWLRLGIGATMIVVALLWLPRFPVPDIAQDYAAARGWLAGRDPNGPTAELLADCCPDLARNYPAMQTAHPPLATLLALPLAGLPWETARALWLLLSGAAVVAAWHIARVSPLVCAVTASFWIIALVLGTHEPLLFVLLAAALLLDARRPLWAGALIGLAAAIKIYPILLLVGLWLSGRRRSVLAALAAGAGAVALTELVLGWGVTFAWMAYTPVNTLRYVDEIGNGSLVRLVRAVIPDASPTLVTLAAFGLLLAPVLPRLRRGDWLRPLLPIILLVSPLSWRHYMGLTALNPLGRIELICLGVAGLAALLVGLEVIPPANMAPLVQGPLLITLLLLWYAATRPPRRNSAAVASGDPLPRR